MGWDRLCLGKLEKYPPEFFQVYLSWFHESVLPGAHYLEPPSPILTLGVNPFPYIFIFRTDLLRILPGVFAPLHQLLHFDPLLLRKRCDLQNNNGEKRGGEFAQHAVQRRNNVFARNMFLKIKRYGKG